MRNTIQRAMVLNSARDLANHPTADEIYRTVREKCPSISKGTVYRNISYLVDENMLKRIEVPGGADRIDFNTADHCHILCDRCGRAFDISVPGYADLLKDIHAAQSAAGGFSVRSCDILLRGICPGCNQ